MRLNRFVALVLAMTLVTDPSTIAAIHTSQVPRSSISQYSFTSQAFELTALSFFHGKGIPFLSRELRQWWRRNARTRTNALWHEARYGFIFLLLTLTGSAIGNFFQRLTHDFIFDIPLQMLLIWAPGTFMLYHRLKREPESPAMTLKPAHISQGPLRRILQEHPVAALQLVGLLTQGLIVWNFAINETLSANSLVNFRPLLLMTLGFLWFKETHDFKKRLFVIVPSILSSALLWAMLPSGKGFQWALPLASVLTTTVFYALQKYLIDKRGIPVPPKRLTLYSGMTNSVVSFLWFLADYSHHWIQTGHPALPSAPWWLTLGVLAGYGILSRFTVLVRYSRGATIFQSTPLSRTSSADFFNEPIHGVVYGALSVGLAWLGFGTLLQNPGMNFIEVVVLSLSLISGLASLMSTDFRLQSIRDERADLQKAASDWRAAVGIGGSYHMPFPEETIAALNQFLNRIKQADLTLRLRGFSPFTIMLQHQFRKLGGLPTQAVWHARLFLHERMYEFDQILYQSHPAMRQNAYLMNLRGNFLLPGGLHTLDDFFAAWAQGPLPTLIEPWIEEPYWAPLILTLQQGWEKTHQHVPAVPRILTPLQLDKEALPSGISKIEAALPSESIAFTNKELQETIRRIQMWSEAVIFRGDPPAGSASYTKALAAASSLLSRGIPIRTEGRGDLSKAIWESASAINRRDLVQSIVKTQADNPIQEPDQTLVVKDLFNTEVALTKRSLLVFFSPGPIATISSLFQLLAYLIEHRKHLPIRLLGEKEFWGPFVAELQHQNSRPTGTLLNPEIFQRMVLLEDEKDIDHALHLGLAHRKENREWSTVTRESA